MLIVKEGKPKYMQVMEYLRFQIDEGDLKPGDKLPSQGFLRKKYGFTQSTIERAHELLEKDGYIERLERKGIFVTPPEKRKHEAAVGLMNRSVLILADNGNAKHEHHKQTGWSDYLMRGAVNEVLEQSRNVMSMAPLDLKTSDIEYWTKHPPLGLVMIGEPVSTPLMLEIAHRLQALNTPVVVYGNAPELKGFDRVISDHEQGNYELTRWLLERGCRCILPMRGESGEAYWIPMRERGYERALHEANVAPMSPCIFPQYPRSEDSHEHFDNAVKVVAQSLGDYIERNGSIDAIMAVTDGAINVLAGACRSLGLEPNRDVIFVGYDHYWEDVEERKFEQTKPLATIDKRNVEMGAQMVQLLSERIAGEVDDAPQCRKVAPQLLTY